MSGDDSTILRKNTCVGSRDQLTSPRDRPSALVSRCHEASPFQQLMAGNSSPDYVSLFLQAEERLKQEEERRKPEEERRKLAEDEGRREKEKRERPNHSETRLKNAPVGQLSWNSYATATTYSPDL